MDKTPDLYVPADGEPVMLLQRMYDEVPRAGSVAAFTGSRIYFAPETKSYWVVGNPTPPHGHHGRCFTCRPLTEVEEAIWRLGDG